MELVPILLIGVVVLSILGTKLWFKFIPPLLSSSGVSSAAWTFPTLLGSALIIAWAAEVAQFIISQGMALALLAWLQTLPEFAVEAVLAWNQDIPNMTANFTGSLRLLVGLGWTLIFFTASYFNRRKKGEFLREIVLDDEHCIEVLGLMVPTAYFFLIYFKATLTLYDSAILISFYILYLWVLRKLPPKKEDETEMLHSIPKRVMRYEMKWRKVFVLLGFLVGGVILYFVAEPFLESMKALALTFGISTFIFIQWVAPFLSEFPEKVSAFYWAQTIRLSSMALMNMISSNINQWTVLVGMIPIVYCLSLKGIALIPFDEFHRTEILLTMIQSILGYIYLLKMRFKWHNALVLFTLWLVQFLFPSVREEIIFVYIGFIALEFLSNAKNMIWHRKLRWMFKNYVFSS
ncbi:MAG: hypothetical protein ACE5HW_00530 [Candidatus Methanofastidiosia archaeon]